MLVGQCIISPYIKQNDKVNRICPNIYREHLRLDAPCFFMLLVANRTLSVLMYTEGKW